VFVTGCHRSGTSLLASLLNAAVGVAPVSDVVHLETQLDNPRGFFESRDLVELNDHLLALVPSQWNHPPLLPPAWNTPQWLKEMRPWRSRLSQYALENTWVDKDPRLCITYPAYLHILLKRVPVAAVLRQPLAVASSLYARDGFALEAGLALWFVYNHHLSASLQQGDLLLSYEQLLQLADPLVSKTVRSEFQLFLERHGHDPLPPAALQAIIDQRLCPELDRASASYPVALAAEVDASLLAVCQRCYDHVLASGSPTVEAYRQAFDSLPRTVLRALAQEGLSCEPAAMPQPEIGLQLERELAASQLQAAELQRRLGAIEASSSWKITAPLRYWKDRWTSLGR
jgi:hypothetical protein